MTYNVLSGPKRVEWDVKPYYTYTYACQCLVLGLLSVISPMGRYDEDCCVC